MVVWTRVKCWEFFAFVGVGVGGGEEMSERGVFLPRPSKDNAQSHVHCTSPLSLSGKREGEVSQELLWSSVVTKIFGRKTPEELRGRLKCLIWQLCSLPFSLLGAVDHEEIIH